MFGGSRDQQSFFYQVIVYVCGFLLFCEWLRPLETITNTKDINVFFIYAAFCFFISFLQVNWWISGILKLVGLTFIIDGLYIAERIFSRNWFAVVYDQIIYNIQVIQAQTWWEMTPMFRSLLFLILLWLMSYLLYYWFIVAQRLFFFVLFTLIYVTVVDTFTFYDGHWAIIRTFVLAMVALGLSSFSLEMDKESVSFPRMSKAHLWVLPLLAVVLFSTVAAYASPKLAPQWPDPVPFIKNAAGGSGDGDGNGGVQKVGYGENDSHLGGSFVQDESIVFHALADKKRYWRIESKDTYTGKGWKDTLAGVTSITAPDTIDFRTFKGQVKTDKQSAYLYFTKKADFKKLVYPYGVNAVSGPKDNLQLRVHNNTGEMDTLLTGGRPGQLNSYQVNYDAPSFEYDLLRETSTEDPQDIKERYLQLPRNLPDRVKNLAGQIVADEDNRYDKSKAVESYFSANGFEYSTKNVAVPKKNQDYVDQFLFETQLGYCDNFSTSMVVLLRSQGIPARWVKGFTGGEQTDKSEEIKGQTYHEFEVTSGNAHSWVEVYFPDAGWVPFEPTKGFTNNTDFYSQIDNAGDNETQPEQDNKQKPESNLGNPAQMEDPANSEGTTANAASDHNFTWIWVSLIAAAAIFTLLYFTRYRWMSVYLIRKYRRNKDKETYEKAYQYLLKILAHKGYKRAPGQTLRDYAIQVDRHMQSDEMRRLTHSYERVLYRNEGHTDQWSKVTELWENLIKKTLS